MDVDKENIIRKVNVKDFKGDNPLNEYAIVGTMFFRNKNIYNSSLARLYEKNIRTNNEFYICPMYNYFIEDGLNVGIHQTEKMHVLGTPQTLEFFSDRVTSKFGDKPIAIACDHSGFELKEKTKTNTKEKL